jgi:hypothetical protein
MMRFILKTLFAAALMGCSQRGLMWLLEPHVDPVFLLAVVLAVGAGIFVAAGVLLRLPELELVCRVVREHLSGVSRAQ